MGHYNYQKDKEKEEESNDKTIAFLKNKFKMTLVDKRDDNKWDYRMRTWRGVILKFEEKQEFMCAITSNVAVEFRCRGKDSGIRVTESDFYIYKVHQPDGVIGLYVILTENLKKMIADKIYFRVELDAGDKGSHTGVYLFMLEDFKEHFRLLGYLPD